MIKFCLAIFLGLIGNTTLFSQATINPNQNNFWFFGNTNYLNFGTPNKEPIKLNGSQLVSVEASSSIADENGNLLFYTDGVSVWDRTHTEMPNGYSLWGSRSGSNGVIILPNPVKKNIFYVFTTSGAEDMSLTFQLPRMGVNYTIVDMNLNNGNGDITQKNINLYYPASEKLAAVKNLVTNQIWLITHELNNNSFAAFRIDSNGVNPSPVISKVGVKHLNNPSDLFNVARGRLAVSPDGTRILSSVITRDQDLWGVFELFDFNPDNGTVSNPQILDSNTYAYSGEFSANGEIVYTKTYDYLYQYNLTLKNIEKIKRNRKQIKNGDGNFFRALQRAPNNKIYIANEGFYYLSVINSPNNLGNDCNFQPYSFPLDSFGLVGLPTFLNSYYNGKRSDTNYLEPILTLDYPRNVCIGDTVFGKLSVNYAKRIKVQFNQNNKLILDTLVKDSILQFALPPLTDSLNIIELSVSNDTNNIYAVVTEAETLMIRANECCTNMAINGSFNKISLPNSCEPIGYQTELDFRSSESKSCSEEEFTATGQINCNYEAWFGNKYFDAQSRNAKSKYEYFLFGDPLPNVPQKAWIQKLPTKLNTKYKFTAYVRNIEKYIRDEDSSKSLDMWIGAANRNYSDTISKINNIKYSEKWREISGIFTPNYYETEFYIGVLGNSQNSITSYGFGIDDITIDPIPNYAITLQNDTTIFEGQSVKLNPTIATEVTAKWSPVAGLDNPNILNPIARPIITTVYYIEAKDRFDCTYKDSILVKVERKVIILTEPEKVCFGDSVYFKVKVNFADKFKCSVYYSFPVYNLLKVGDGSDSIANISLPPFTDYNNYLRVIVEDISSEPIKDSVNFTIYGRDCCGDVVENGRFYAISANRDCRPIDYKTDFDFRSSSTSACPLLFTAFGQMNSQSQAVWGHPNFDATTHSNPIGAFFIYGDPLINIPQRAWYQKNPTRLNTKYKFTAFVRNVEKITRNNTTNGKNLGFWLGTKDNISSDTIARIENVEYNQDWIELSGNFTARENETELSVGVVGKSGDNLSSYGFGIDDITLIPLPDYNIVLTDTLKIDYGKDIKLDAQFNANVSATWSPQTNLDNPYILNPIASPKKTTIYYLEVIDKYGCKYKDSTLIVVNQTKPVITLTKPDKVCFGDSVYFKVKVNFADKFKCSVYNSSQLYSLLQEINGSDSIANIILPPFTEYNNYLRVIVEDIATEPIKDSVSFGINARQCCGDVVVNGDFESISNVGSPRCYTVNYNTDLDFRSSSTSGCPSLFTALGQMNSESQAEWGHPNFDAKSHSTTYFGAYFIYGDPLINFPQRAWYQKNPTRINTKYKFTAFVRNVEKITRNNTTNGKNLGFWLGTKDNISSDTIARIENVEYNQDWLELTGYFTARENETELSVGVVGESGDNLSSYGFGIDDITLFPLPDYTLSIANSDTLICKGDSITLIGMFDNPIDIKWTPITGLSNPNSLITIAKPKVPKLYKLETTDKYGCKFIDSVFVGLKNCDNLCKPQLSIKLSDTTIEVGNSFCIKGNLLAKCDNLPLPDTLEVLFKIPAKLFKILTASEDYTLITDKSFNNLLIKFPSAKLTIDKVYNFEICLVSYLSDTLKSDFSAEEDTNQYILIENDPSYITLTMCADQIRFINLFTLSEFEANVSNDKLNLYLTTEEKGEFEFILTDITGSQVSSSKFISDKDIYRNELIQSLDISQLSTGNYFLQMKLPDGKIKSKRIVITK